ncbi:MAG TPA: autotransporter domain-containing protein [Xanthobacteraceae bacterium]
MALLCGTGLGTLAAHAQDATWVGNNGGDPNEWVEPNNWTPATVPSGTATFTNTGVTTVANDNGIVIIGAIDFTANAQAYTINVDNPFIVNAAGVTNNSTNTQTFNVTSGNTLVFQNSSTANNGAGAVTYNNDNGGFIDFNNTSNAGNANTTITNSSILQFNDSSSAGSAQITNNVQMDFFTSASAGNASITNVSAGTITFNNNATASAATIVNAGTVDFNNSSMGGTANITNNSGGSTTFGTAGGTDTSMAGGATITNNNGGSTTFDAMTTAGTANITNTSGGVLTFNDSSSAGTATIANNTGFIFFNNNASAGGASIQNVGSITFANSSTAGTASIVTQAGGFLLSFADTSTAGTAIITTDNGSKTQFTDNATGGGARFITNAGGTVDFSASTGPAGNNQLSAGSIEGAGNYYLGANALTVGDSLSTTVSGVISDCGVGGTACNNSGVTGGSLIKVGVGTLTLTGTNTYSGGTTIDSGEISIGNVSGLGSGTLTFNGSGVTLEATVSGTLANSIAINSGVSATIGVASGQSLTLGGPSFVDSGGGTLHLGSATDTGTITLMPGSTTTIAGSGAISVDGGTVVLGNGLGAGIFTGLQAGTTVGSGVANATLDLNGQMPTVWNLTGASDGTITNNAAATTLTADNTANSIFAGVIKDGSGTLALTKTGPGTLILTATDTYTDGTTISGGILQVGNGGTSGSITGNVTDNGILAFNRSDTVTFAGVVSGSGGLSQIGSGTLILTGTNTYTGGTTISSGTLQLGNGGATGSVAGTGTITDNGTLAIDLSSNINIANTISGSGSLAQIGGGVTTLTGTDTYTGGTVISAGTLQIGAGGANATTGLIAGNVIDNGVLAFARSDAVTFAGVISGTGIVQQNDGGALTLSGANSYSGGTALNSGTLVIGNNSALGTGTLAMAAGTTLSFLNSNFTIANHITIAGDPNFTPPSGTTQTLSGVIADGSSPGTLNMNGAGTLVLSATNTYTGPTNVDSGTLEITGSIASSTLTTVEAGGTLTGNGTIGNLTIASGGTFTPGSGTPGTTTTVAGNLAFQSGAIYLVQINPTTASFAKVAGTASLAGTVDAVFTSGSYLTKQYVILQSAGLNGTTFSSLSTTNLPADAQASLAYTTDDVLLDLSVSLPTSGLNVNQQNVANTINNFINSGGAISGGFANLFNLTGSSLANSLTQLDGEDATGAEHGAFELTNEFLSLMLDPFVYGRGGPASGGGALGFAPDQQASFPPDVALAYAGLLKAPPKQAFDQRWTVWGAGYGGSGAFNGDPATGSTNVTASTYGFAAGADYHATPDTVFGFALAGAGTNWGLEQGLGTGRSDAFQAGAYGTKYFGPAYVGAALAFTNNWFTTNRTALGDQLTANFQGQSFGVRVESGYRYAVASAMGVTPYAAIQAQNFHTPTYSETDLTGGGFGLTYSAMTATDTRSELGARFDALTAWGAMPVQLRARLAWAHDWVDNPALSAAFQALPGSSFVVNGAPVPHDSALTTVGAELHLAPQWTLIGKFDGEFANSAQIYAGSGTLRYTW